MKLMPIVTDTYDFPTLIREGYVYVDKTALLHRLVSGVDGRFFFMSRPRRFGKSLMISTLEQIFKGEKKLFKGLDIEKMGYDWKKYPIIRLDMTAFDHTSGLALFKESLAHELGGTEPIAALRALIAKKAKASRGKGVVVLIDEYDSPVSSLLGKDEELDAMREFLQTFYRILKQEAASIRFLMMTGVSKFTKLSVFSGLNNLTDLTMSATYAGLLGYTPEELNTTLASHIEAFAQEKNTSFDAIKEKLLDWYDSYRFSPDSEVKVCNPVSVGRALATRKIEGYWSRTGGSTLIIERLSACNQLPLDIERLETTAKRLDVCDLKDLPFAALMYQGGYLTIKDVKEDGSLILGIPNYEVREAIYGGFLDEVLKNRADDFTSHAFEIRKMLSKEADGAKLQQILSSVFAMVPHEWKINSEAEAKRYFLLFMKMAGADITPELQSSKGRADAVVETDSAVYIFEFKYGKSAKAALKQIEAKGYANPYVSSTRKIVTVGVSYNSRTGVIESECGTVNGTVKAERNGTVNSDRVFDLICTNPGIRRPRLRELTGLSDRTLARLILSLSKRVEFRGAPKNGGYYVCCRKGKSK